MYTIIKNVITIGNYELSDILTKIDTLWITGELTNEQHDELIALARDNATPEQSYAPLAQQVDALFENVAEIAAEVESLKGRVTALEGGEVTPPTPEEEYPEYVQPTGAHDAYHNGDKITHNGKKYTCIAPEGTAVVWNPDEYPAYWQLVEESTEDTEEPEVEPTE